MPMLTTREGKTRRLRRMTAVVGAALMGLAALSAPAPAQEDDEAAEKARQEMNAQSYFKGKPPFDGPVQPQKGYFRMPVPPKRDIPKFQFQEPISAEAKMRFMQTLMGYNPFSLRQMINFMAAKKKAAPGLSFDEVVESLRLKGNELNMRFVGVSTPYKVIREIRGDDKYPRVEIYSFCDLETLALVLEHMPEFIVFIPCRIAVMEDKEGNIWLVTLDWDVRWIDTLPNPNRISDELRKRAISVRERLEVMMEAAANGDL